MAAERVWRRLSPRQKREMIVDHMALRVHRRQETRRMSKKNRVRSSANRVVHSNQRRRSRARSERDFLRQIVTHGRFARDRREARDLLSSSPRA